MSSNLYSIQTHSFYNCKVDSNIDFTYFSLMLINAHTHHISREHISVLNFYPFEEIPKVNQQTLLSCGIHPWHIKTTNIDNALANLEELCLQNKIDAIGECGLDKNVEDIELQHNIFVRHIELSEKYELPLIIHSVKTHNLIINHRRKTNPKSNWILHGYTGSFEMAHQLIKQNIFISLGPYLLHQPQKAHQLLNKLNQNYVLFETDDSIVDIKEIYEKASLLSGNTLTELEKRIELNFNRIF